MTKGPSFGYYPKPSKTILVVKPSKLDEAANIFGNDGIQIQDGGHRDLGAAIGSSSYVKMYLQEKTAEWVGQLSQLARIAKTQPHAAHAAYTFGMRSRWTFAQRTMERLPEVMQAVEDVLCKQFIPALLGDNAVISPLERRVYALPAREGGLGIANPVSESPYKFAASNKFTQRMQELLMKSESRLLVEEGELKRLKSEIKQDNKDRATAEAVALCKLVSPEMQRAIALAQDPGASAVITTSHWNDMDLQFAQRETTLTYCV